MGVAYLWEDSFDKLSHTPLNITQGDVRASIEAVGNNTWAPATSDPQADKILGCLRAGVPAAQLVRLFEAVRDGAASTNPAEQAHASGAVLLSSHKQLEERLLRARSNVHQCMAMVRPSHDGRRVEQLERRCEKLDRAQV